MPFTLTSLHTFECDRQLQGLMYLDLHTRGPFTVSSDSTLDQGKWPRSSWAGAVSTPGSSMKSQRSSSVSLGGAAGSASSKSGKDAVKMGGVAFGMPGYGGMGAWGGWEDWEDVDSVVDPIATVDNVRTKTLAAHPSQPIFLVGSNNTHVYLWEVWLYNHHQECLLFLLVRSFIRYILLRIWCISCNLNAM